MANDGYNNLYNVTLMVILEYLADTNCYRARPVIDANSRVSYYILHSVDSVGAAGADNKEGAPQVARIYRAQTQVLACIPAFIETNPLTEGIGYIIGEVSTMRAADKSLKEFRELTENKSNPTIAKVGDIEYRLMSEGAEGSVFDGDAVMRDINIDNNTVATNTKNIMEHNQLRYTGNQTADILSDDYSINGAYTRFLVDDYVVNIKTDKTNVTHSAITGELAEQSMLRSEQTIASSKYMYVIGDSSLFVNKYSFNVGRSYFNCYDDDFIPKQDAAPSYDYVEHIGEVVEGRLSTLYSTSKDANGNRRVAFQERLKTDGSLEVNSTKGISLKHTTKYYNIVCKPPVRVVSEDLNEEKNYVKITEKKALNTQYADDDTDGRLLPCLAQQELEDVSDSTEWPYIGESAIDLLDDGSIKLTDAWGSYILLSRGNVQIHAANDTFITSRRHNMMTAGDTTVLTSSKVTDIASDDLTRVSSKKSMEISSPILLQNHKTITINSTTTNMKTTYLTTDSRYINVGRKSAEIAITGSTIASKASRNNVIATSYGCINLTGGGSCYICGNMKIGGNIDTGSLNQTITISGTEYTYSSKGTGRITVHNSSLYVAKTIIAFKNVMASGVYARTVAHEKGKYVYRINLNLSAYDSVITADIADQTYDIFDDEDLRLKLNEKTLSIDAIWDKPGIYIAQTGEGKGSGRQSQMVYSNNGKKHKGLGSDFWDKDGVLYLTDKDSDNKQNRKGFQTYRYETPATTITVTDTNSNQN